VRNGAERLKNRNGHSGLYAINGEGAPRSAYYLGWRIGRTGS
jgi:hypothetical protein